MTLKITDGKGSRENKGRDVYGKRGKMYVYACVCVHVRDSTKKERTRGKGKGIEL